MVDIISGTEHVVDPAQAAQEARDHGMAAIVLKPHEFPSVLAAHIAQQSAPGMQVLAESRSTTLSEASTPPRLRSHYERARVSCGFLPCRR